MSQSFATAVVPPRASMMVEAVMCSMAAILGAPNGTSQGTPNVRAVRIAYMSTMAQRIRSAMDDRGVIQADVARACDVAAPSVNNWLSGKTQSLRADTAYKLSKFLKVNQLWLIEGRGPRDISPSDNSNPASDVAHSVTEKTAQKGPDLDAVHDAVCGLLRSHGLTLDDYVRVALRKQREGEIQKPIVARPPKRQARKSVVNSPE